MSTNQFHPSLDCLIHLGSGSCNDLDQYLARCPGRLVLVESDPKLVDSLRQRVADRGNVQVLNAAVAAESGERTYHCFNLPTVNSLRQPTGLRLLYPGLRLLEERRIQAQGVNQFLDSLELAPDQSNGLAIELAGEEGAVLEALEAGDKLHHFCEIELVAGRESLYEGSKPAHLILQWLESNGYEVRGEDAGYDRERPRWRLRRNDLVLEMRVLREQIEQLTSTANQVEELKSLADVHLAAREAAESANQAHELTIEELKAALASANKERDEQSQLAKEQTQRIQELMQSSDQLTASDKKLKAALALANKEKEEQSKLAQEQSQRVQDVIRSSDQLAAEAEKAKADLSVAIRLQALREADLKEMQQRYAAVVETRDQQNELLVKLQRRLGSAATFLRELESRSSDENDGALAGELIRKLAGDWDTDKGSDAEPTA